MAERRERKKKVFVTGATGFIGSNLTRRLAGDSGYDVHVLLRRDGNPWRIGDIRGSLNEHYADMRDITALRKVVEDVKPSWVFHCAVYGGYPDEKDPAVMMETNLNGLVNLLTSLSGTPCDSFVNLGTSSEYGLKDGPMREDDPLCPTSAYGVSKAAAAMYARMMAVVRKMPVTTARPFSIYGPYERGTRLVPSIIKACLDGNPITIRTPQAVRDFVYVDDAVDMFLKAASQEKALGVLNLGSGRQRTVRDVVETVMEITGTCPEVAWGGEMPPFDPNPWMADMSRTEKAFGWRPKTTFEDGLKKTIEWFRGQRTPVK